MKLTNENVLIGSLMGSTVAKLIPRAGALENELSKHILPPVKILPFIQNKVGYNEVENDYNDSELWRQDKPLNEQEQFFPFSFRSSKDENFWLLPWEPIINIEAKTIIAKRYIAKAGKNYIGSVKERWSVDDYSITITGAFYGKKMRGNHQQTYPREDMERLKNYLLTAEALEVRSEPLQILGINRIVIESVTFPFTKGENVQAYEIKAVSDFPFKLLYEHKKTKAKIEIGDISSELIKE